MEVDLKFLVLFLYLFACANTQNIGSGTVEEHPPITIFTCDEQGCQPEQSWITLDDARRPVYSVADMTTPCETYGVWDPILCPDSVSCAENCALDGVTIEEYQNLQGVTTSETSVTLKYVTESPYFTNIGSNLYLVNSEEEYRMFQLKNREFTVDIDTSTMECGMNGALYFIEMEKDGGMSSFPTNKAGAKYGTGYCDGQCSHWKRYIAGQVNTDGDFPYGICCAEMDIWEANKYEL